MPQKHIITILGIRPDWVRISEVIKKIDQNFKHTLIHTGQHFDHNLSGSFFQDLNIRTPDYNFSIGQNSSDHFEQLSYLSLKIREYQDLIKSADAVFFLGDSNSVLASILIKKLRIPVAHIEAGMRSYDIRMFEEINRKTCDHCSDVHFVYHENYKSNLIKEGIPDKHIYVVGNTITEVVKNFVPQYKKLNNAILVDIHRPENFLSKERLEEIFKFINQCGAYYGVPVELIGFKRTMEKISEFHVDIGSVKVIDLMSFPDYINKAYHSRLVISDSGTAQEELAYLKTPVIAPRDFTERKESMDSGCSILLDVNNIPGDIFSQVENLRFDTSWMGDGKTSDKIVEYINKFFNEVQK